MAHERDIARTVENIGPRYLDRLNDLVSIDCGTHNIAGVNTVGDSLSEMWAMWGWEVGKIPQYEHGDCRVARIRGTGKGKIMLLGHLDTVYKDGVAQANPMHSEQDPKKGNILKGPGVCDMKASILSGMYAMRALQLAEFDDFEEIVFVCNGDEEKGSPESKSAYESIAKQMDAVLVLESARPDGEIVSARKGVGIWNIDLQSNDNQANPIIALAQKILEVNDLNGIREGVTLNPGVVKGSAISNKESVQNVSTKRYRVNVQGKESHAGVEPEKGANSIVELAHKILEVDKLNTTDIKVNPIAIKGGTVRNTVPGRAAVVVEIQTTRPISDVETLFAQILEKTSVPGTYVELSEYDDTDDYIQLEHDSSNKASLVTDLRAFDKPSIDALEAALKSLQKPDDEIIMNSDGKFTNPHMPKTQAIGFLVELAKKAGEEIGLQIQDKATGGGSDANIIASFGTPVLDGLGPVGGEDHNADTEYINIDSVIPRIRLLAGLIQYICANREQLQTRRNSE